MKKNLNILLYEMNYLPMLLISMVYAMLYVILPESLAISIGNKKKHHMEHIDETSAIDHLYMIEVPEEVHKATDMISPQSPAFDSYEADHGQTNIILNPN